MTAVLAIQPLHVHQSCKTIRDQAITRVSTTLLLFLHKTKPSGMFQCLQRDKGTFFVARSCLLKHVCRLLNFHFHPTFTTSVIMAAPAVVWTRKPAACAREIVILNHQHGQSQTTMQQHLLSCTQLVHFLQYFIGVKLKNHSPHVCMKFLWK